LNVFIVARSCLIGDVKFQVRIHEQNQNVLFV
jgi:hypothetical protein